jgi:hypothetical protein
LQILRRDIEIRVEIPVISEEQTTMDAERIDFISAYCDRWCERCAFTARCSLFAVQAARAMTGDVREALELAVGVPHPESNEEPEGPTAEWIAEMNAVDVSDPDVQDALRSRDRRHEAAEDSPIGKLAWAISLVALHWLQARDGHPPADQVLAEAMSIALHDAAFIAVKLMRALEGRLEFQSGEADEDNPIQNDWNGSAKVALISIERSENAWRTISQASADETPSSIADQLSQLRTMVEAEFPNAWKFVRPGFDEPVS